MRLEDSGTYSDLADDGHFLVILHVLANALGVDEDGNLVLFQLLLGTDAG